MGHSTLDNPYPGMGFYPVDDTQLQRGTLNSLLSFWEKRQGDEDKLAKLGCTRFDRFIF